MGGTKKDDFGSTLQSMTMRDWIERVCQLQNSVEYRDRVIADQKKTIASQLAIIQRLRASVEKLESTATTATRHETTANPPSTTERAAHSARKPSK